MSSALRRLVPRSVSSLIGTFALIVAALGAFPESAKAEVNRWSSQGPFGGSVKAVAVDRRNLGPVNPETVYVGVDIGPDGGGTGGVFFSDDGGITWNSYNTPNLTELRIQALALNTLDPPTLYAGTNGGGVFKRRDGEDWEQINGVFPTEITNLSVLTLVIDPEDPNVIYAGTNGGGVFKTEDNGMTWAEMNFGLGNRVVFDLEIPVPFNKLVINEVDADTPGVMEVDETEEFIELFGPPNQSLSGFVLVLYDGSTTCESYAAYDLDEVCVGNPGGECFLDGNGFFVIGDPGVPGVNAPIADFNLLNSSTDVPPLPVTGAAVALYIGDATDFPDDTNATGNDSIDALIYDTNDSDSICLLTAFGSFAEQVNEGGGGDKEGHSNSRFPDGGERFSSSRYTQQDSTPGKRNREIKTVLAATDLEGIYRTEDRGTTWVPFNNGLTSPVAFSIAIDPIDPSSACLLSQTRIYVGTSGGGIFRNTDPCDVDLEEDWEPASSGLPENTTVLSMAVAPALDPDPLNPVNSILYAGTELGQIFRSVDQGDQWNETSNNLRGLNVEALEIDERIDILQDPSRPSTVYAGTFGAGAFKSIDSASNWFPTGFELDGLIGVFSQSVVVDHQNVDVVYAGTFGGGVFRADDGGATEASWRPVNGQLSGMALGGSFVNAMAMDPVDPSRLYVGTDLNGMFRGDAVMVMGDPDFEWEAINTGLTDSSIFDVEVDPATPETLYAATGQVFKSLNEGTSWTPMNTGFGDSFVLEIAIDPTDSQVLYAGTLDDGVFKSIDAGATWSDINSGLTEAFVRTLVVNPEDPTIVYAGTDGGGVFKSADGGAVWEPSNNGLPPSLIVLNLIIDQDDPNIVFAGTSGSNSQVGGVFRSLDGGSTWSSFNTGLTNFTVNELAIAPRPLEDSPNITYAATFGGGIFDYNRVDRFEIEPTTGLVTTEAGGTATFTVRLTSQPTANVTLGLTSSDITEGLVDPEALFFSDENWFVEQFVTITGQPDAELDGDQVFLIKTEPAVSLDPDFDGVDPDDVSVTNEDLIIPPAGVVVTPTTGLVTTELGVVATFTVRLATTPSENILINLASSDLTEASASPAQLVFTPENGTDEQTVTVTGLQDGELDGDQNFLILVEIDASVTDPDYNAGAIDPADPAGTNIDSGLVNLYESADLGPVGQGPSGPFITSNVFLGAKFTVTELITVASLGGHLVADDNISPIDPSIFVAVVPLDGAGEFPASTNLAPIAVFGTEFDVPIGSSGEVNIPASFELEAGRYGIVFGSGQFGATGRARMPAVDFDIGSPEYFFSDNTLPPGTEYSNGGFSNARFFLSGFIGRPEALFADGFESGDTSAWSSSSP